MDAIGWTSDVRCHVCGSCHDIDAHTNTCKNHGGGGYIGHVTQELDLDRARAHFARQLERVKAFEARVMREYAAGTRDRHGKIIKKETGR
jgi:hypothetical protein